MSTIYSVEDSVSGRVLHLKCDFGANGLMIFCYPEDRLTGEPLAILQLAAFQNEVEVLYWKQDNNDRGPERLVLAKIEEPHETA